MEAGSHHLSLSDFPYDRVDRPQQILREMMFRSTLTPSALKSYLSSFSSLYLVGSLLRLNSLGLHISVTDQILKVFPWNCG